MAEHQAETKRSLGGGVETTGQFPEAIPVPVPYGPGVAALAVCLNQAQLLPLARTGEGVAEVFGCLRPERTLEKAVADCHEQLAGVEAAIKRGVAPLRWRILTRQGWTSAGRRPTGCMWRAPTG